MLNIEALDFIPNICILIGLVGIVEYYKGQNKKAGIEKKPKFYGNIFVVLCIFISLSLSILNKPEIEDDQNKYIAMIAQGIIYMIVYWGAGTLGYQTIIKFAKKFIDKLVKKVEE